MATALRMGAVISRASPGSASSSDQVEDLHVAPAEPGQDRKQRSAAGWRVSSGVVGVGQLIDDVDELESEAAL
jgi:hypothetical protein